MHRGLFSFGPPVLERAFGVAKQKPEFRSQNEYAGLTSLRTLCIRLDFNRESGILAARGGIRGFANGKIMDLNDFWGPKSIVIDLHAQNRWLGVVHYQVADLPNED
jgi:hypothetical protein